MEKDEFEGAWPIGSEKMELLKETQMGRGTHVDAAIQRLAGVLLLYLEIGIVTLVGEEVHLGDGGRTGLALALGAVVGVEGGGFGKEEASRVGGDAEPTTFIHQRHLFLLRSTSLI